MNEETVTSVQAAFYEAVRTAAKKIAEDIANAVEAISELIEPCIAVIAESLESILGQLRKQLRASPRDLPRAPRDLFPASVRIADKRAEIRAQQSCRRFSGR